MNVEQKLTQDTNIALLGTLFLEKTKAALEADIQRLQTEREHAGRFLKIDEELQELERVTHLKASVLAESEMQASAIREAARQEADRLTTSARQAAETARTQVLAAATKAGETILLEANQAASAQRQSAEAVYNEARRKTAGVDEALAGRLADCEAREAAIRVKIAELEDRQTQTGRIESAVDSKRQMLRAGIEALRRVLDEIQT